MPIDPLYLLLGLVFLGAFLFVEGIYYFISDGFGGRSGANRRMRMLSGGAEKQKVYAQLRRSTPRHWDKLGQLGALLQSLNKLIAQAGVSITVERLLVVMIGLSIVAFLLLAVLVARTPSLSLGPSSLLVAGMLAVAFGAGGPTLYLLFKKSRRLKRFGEQLPDALDMMVRSLRAGHPVSVAMTLAAEQMPDPIGTEIGIAVDEMTYGLELREALANVGDRVDVQDFQYVVVAISIQHDTGGNLADVLGGLANVIRSRFRMFKKVRALSSEGRFSAKILGGLPFAFAGMTFSAQPGYYLQVAGDPMFHKVIALALALQMIGIFIMHKLINFRV